MAGQRVGRPDGWRVRGVGLGEGVVGGVDRGSPLASAAATGTDGVPRPTE